LPSVSIALRVVNFVATIFHRHHHHHCFSLLLPIVKYCASSSVAHRQVPLLPIVTIVHRHCCTSSSIALRQYCSSSSIAHCIATFSYRQVLPIVTATIAIVITTAHRGLFPTPTVVHNRCCPSLLLSIATDVPPYLDPYHQHLFILDRQYSSWASVE
jgi:hypothetical protein